MHATITQSRHANIVVECTNQMTAEVETPKGFRQRLRLRELSKYYCAASPIAGQKLRDEQWTDQSFDSSASFVPLHPRLSHDGTLTALAQLAALKLRCQRSIISIIDDSWQHVIAEATQSISTEDVTDHAANDGLIFGAQSLPVNYGICPATLDAFLDERQITLDDPNNTVNRDHLVIADLLKESRTRGAPALRDLPPVLRYYVEVPLRTDSGYLLGSICVIDPSVRRAGPKDIKALQEKIIAELHGY